jgi:hypothetical protein
MSSSLPSSPAVAVVANAVVAVVAYDYDKLVSEIMECRQLILDTEMKMGKMKKGDDNVGVVGIVGNDVVIDLLTQSVNKFELLSGYCPMTPLLWMQYGSDAYKLMSYMTSSQEDDEVNEDDMGDVEDFVSGSSSEVIAIQTRLQVLELGLHEFPGCAVLRLHYVEIMLVQLLLIIHNIAEANYNEIATDEDLNTAEGQIIRMKQKYKHAVEDAIAKIGLGSHRNESQLIVKLYQMRMDMEIQRAQVESCSSITEQQQRDYHTGSCVTSDISTLFVKRAFVPMNDDINSSLNDEYTSIIHGIPKPISKTTKRKALNEMEYGRRYESKYYGFLIIYEDDIEISLQSESNVSLRNGMNQITTAAAAARATTTTTAAAHAAQQQQNDHQKKEIQYLLNKWEPILNNNSDNSSSNNIHNCWMGLGGSQTAQTFINYAQSCFRFRSSKQLSGSSGSGSEPKKEEEQDEGEENEKKELVALQETIHDLAISVYERGIAECPTVDKLWISYLKRLMYLIEQTKTELEQQLDENDNDEKEEQKKQQKLQQLLIDTSNVVDRGIRNCPYSIELIQMKFTILLEKVNSKQMILDPEEIYTKFIKEQIFDLGFIGSDSNEVTQMFQLLIALIRKRILYILADTTNKRGYDPSDIMMKKNKNYKGKNKNTTPTRLNYDDPESIQGALNNNSNNNSNNTANSNNKAIIDDNNDNEEIQEELEDLCSDLREIYDEGDSYLRNSKDKIKNNKQQVEEGRALLAKDRVITETYLISPLLVTIQQQSEEESESELESSSSLILLTERKEKVIELLKQYEKGTKVQFQAPHPNVFMSYIQALKAVHLSVSSCTLTNPIDIITNLRRIRFLYQKAITFVGKPMKKGPTNSRVAVAVASDNNDNNVDELDYETSLRCLCHEYTVFEKYFGSKKSYSECIKVTQKKLSKAFANQAVQEAAAAAQAPAQTSIGIDAADDDVTTKATSQNKKRKLLEENRPNEGGGGIDQKPPPVKKQKGGGKEEETDHPMEVKDKTNSFLLSQQQKHKIKIGKLEYPAHPYTVKVSCLHPNTEDMDLVNTLRPKCGPIVHAKIMREKHNKTKSKGWGLVQFEERTSVEKALQLSDSVDIKMKCVKIERSHIAAVSLVAVPPSNLDQNRNHNARGGSGTGSHHHQNRNHNARGGGGGGGGRGLNKNNKNKHPKNEKDTGDGEGKTKTTTSSNKQSNNDLQQEHQKGGDGDVDMNKKPASSSTTKTKTTNVSKKSVLTFLPRGVGKK